MEHVQDGPAGAARRRNERARGAAWLALGWALVLVGCAAPPRHSTVDVFRDTRLLESRLHKGISTMDEVRQVLGEPTGSGAVLLAGLQQQPQQIWFYQDIELTDMKAVQGQLDLQMRQQILIVFVREDRFDGFMWFSNADAATAWVKDILRGRVGR
jgi:hypothetical protein